ncbi:Hypothetical predicted protein [Paramuricea clavata]|uniref:Uncharacterized protein n=1 Tax=Paramuricea clavata TaxID=317549 RepID=A0A7D9IQ28_PARCT|nr:Hypothetical predicted protein [Paramuricea clavata]
MISSPLPEELPRYMQINYEKDVDSMRVTEVENRLTILNERKEGEDETEMRERLKLKHQMKINCVTLRPDCLEELSDATTTTTGVPVADKRRFFHGYSPSCQYEASQQKDRQQLVFKGPHGKANFLAKSNKPFHGLTKPKLNTRSIYKGEKERIRASLEG